MKIAARKPIIIPGRFIALLSHSIRGAQNRGLWDIIRGRLGFVLVASGALAIGWVGAGSRLEADLFHSGCKVMGKGQGGQWTVVRDEIYTQVH
jgi:hypothetical protein